MDNRLLIDQQMMQRELDYVVTNGLAQPANGCIAGVPDEPAISAVRDIAGHLPHHGFSS
jgi:hypothetical protein